VGDRENGAVKSRSIQALAALQKDFRARVDVNETAGGRLEPKKGHVLSYNRWERTEPDIGSMCNIDDVAKTWTEKVQRKEALLFRNNDVFSSSETMHPDGALSWKSIFRCYNAAGSVPYSQL
jgi:hypothetical protein